MHIGSNCEQNPWWTENHHHKIKHREWNFYISYLHKCHIKECFFSRLGLLEEERNENNLHWGILDSTFSIFPYSRRLLKLAKTMRENCTTTMPWRSSEKEASSLNYSKTLLFPLCMHNNFRTIDTKLTSPVEVVNIKRKQEITQQMNTSSVLYMPMVTPPVPVNSNTSVVSFSLPSAGL